MSTVTEMPEKMTPMFRQYFDIKERYPDCLLLFRCGDFYELYGEDAVRGAKAMEIALTSRDAGQGKRIEMAGVPYHALDNYLKPLITKGIKVAVCEQLEDPKKAKGLVKRDVTKVITSGTVIDPNMLAEDQNNFLMALFSSDDKTGISFADISTGELKVTTIPSYDISRVKDEIFRVRPKEIIISEDFEGIELLKEFISGLEIAFNTSTLKIEGLHFKEILKSSIDQDSIEKIDWNILKEAGISAAILIDYINNTQKTEKHSIHNIEFYDISEHLVLDAITWRNLELSHTITERQKKGSLLWVIDDTKTGMGARLIRSWLERPLLDQAKINARLDGVDEFAKNYTLHTDVISRLKTIHDLERITSRVVYGSANARDLVALRNSIAALPSLKNSIKHAESSILKVLHDSLDTLEDIYSLLWHSIADEPPAALKEGGIIKEQYNLELDELRDIRKNAREWIAALEEKERENTGIRSLKIRFNNVFGYFIEVTKTNLHLVPDNYIRKQTIANGERFISPELKEYESKVLGAEEKIIELEYNIFIGIRDKIAAESARIQEVSRIIAILDVLASLASVALKNKYCRPEITADDIISIKNGRHPVVEKFIPTPFVPNSTDIEKEKSRFHVITGPNMSGKSTYLRQIGLIAIMAQMGSFVPAESAKIGIVDRVFTRVGASDDLMQGKSTFLVEMSETANIVNNATRRSLVLLDEIGRGTSTYDGLSIAWAVSEYIHNRINARTLFATHFHQLTDLAGSLPGVKNFRVEVKETSKEVIFLHRIVAGGTDKSYGIYVAKLAGLPGAVLTRAAEILDELEASHGKPAKPDQDDKAYQLTFFDYLQTPLESEIININPDKLSPREALDKIYEWKRSISG